MARTRVLIARLPRLSRELIGKALALAPGLEVLQAEDLADPVEAVRRTRPHAVVAGVPVSGDAALADRLRQERPELRVIELSQDGRRAWATGPGSPRRALEEVSAAALLVAIG